MARGYNALADVLRTADGVDVNRLFAEIQQAVAARNAQRQRWLDLLTYRTTQPSETVLQVGDTSNIQMEEASEYGLPQGLRVTGDFTTMSARAKWYDIGAKFTYRGLADMPASQVQAVTNAALEADGKKVYELVMSQLFRPTNTQFTEGGVAMTQFTFWNGDGTVPPTYNGQSFDGTHTHFRTSGAAQVQSGDLDEIITDLKSHGFSAETGTTLVLLVNPAEAQVINGFRVADGAAEDFVPAAGARFFTPDYLLGEQPAASWGGFAVKGAYGELLVIEDSRVPAGYLVALASGGENVKTAPIMLREHPRLTGLQIIPGQNGNYPLVESYFTHFVGAGVRQRGAGLVMPITANAAYEPPSVLAI
jgi:hypothetical protein